MRVACIGNMNHIFFSLTRFLRDKGVQADLLLVDDEFEHFHPECDSFDDSYKAYTVSLSWGSAVSFFKTTRRTVRRDLSSYDVVIGCGFTPAFCEKIGRCLDLFVPYGGDLFMFPFGIGERRWWTRLPGRYLSAMQRRGIERARRIFCLDVFGPYRRALQALGVAYERLPCTPIYYAQYDRMPEFKSKLAHADRFDALRGRYRFLVFSHSRHYWTPRAGKRLVGGKGNDVLIEGFAHYLRESGVTDVGLVLFEYGDDVKASRELCGHLGIGDKVHWLPQMSRRELMYGAMCSDVGADEFPDEADGAYGGTTIEFMSVGKAVLGRLFYTPEQFLARVGFSMPPLLNALSSKGLAATLAGLVEHEDVAAAAGWRSREWVAEHYGAKLVDRYVDVIRGG